MSLLDQVIEKASGFFEQHREENELMLGAIMQLVNSPQTGGIHGLMQSFDKAGLGDIFKSWVSVGRNLPIAVAEIESVFGAEQIGNLARQLNIDTGQASAKLAEYLPQVIDKLTPNGSLPEGADLVAQGAALLKSKRFG
jgi:uncharacterized protein YidB (DUF937 family)